MVGVVGRSVLREARMSERVSSEYALHLKIVQLEQRIKELEEALVGMRDMAATSGRRATSVTLEFLERVLRGGGEDE